MSARVARSGNTYRPGPLGYRFTNQDRKGSILTRPDDERLQRGPTYGILPDGKMVKVPNAVKHNTVAPSDMHEQKYGGEMMELLKSLMEGRKMPKAEDNRGMVNFDRRPNFFTRQADIGDGHVAHF
jgi:hypothetical protein